MQIRPQRRSQSRAAASISPSTQRRPPKTRSRPAQRERPLRRSASNSATIAPFAVSVSPVALALDQVPIFASTTAPSSPGLNAFVARPRRFRPGRSVRPPPPRAGSTTTEPGSRRRRDLAASGSQSALVDREPVRGPDLVHTLSRSSDGASMPETSEVQGAGRRRTSETGRLVHASSRGRRVRDDGLLVRQLSALRRGCCTSCSSRRREFGRDGRTPCRPFTRFARWPSMNCISSGVRPKCRGAARLPSRAAHRVPGTGTSPSIQSLQVASAGRASGSVGRERAGTDRATFFQEARFHRFARFRLIDRARDRRRRRQAVEVVHRVEPASSVRRRTVWMSRRSFRRTGTSRSGGRRTSGR